MKHTNSQFILQPIKLRNITKLYFQELFTNGCYIIYKKMFSIKRNMRFYMSAVLCVQILFFGCNKETAFDCVKKSGSNTSEERILSSFNEIEINCHSKVILHQDTLYKIIIHGGKNLIASVSSDVINQKLVIDNENYCNWVRSYKKNEIQLEIYFPSVRKICVYGSTDFKSEGILKLDSLDILFDTGVNNSQIEFEGKSLMTWVSSNGHYSFKGSADYFYHYNASAGEISAQNLTVEFAHVVNKMFSEIYVNATNLLLVEEISDGNIYYFGSPNKIIIQNTSGNGKLIPINTL
jgi:hypothetical protein